MCLNCLGQETVDRVVNKLLYLAVALADHPLPRLLFRSSALVWLFYRRAWHSWHHGILFRASQKAIGFLVGKSTQQHEFYSSPLLLSALKKDLESWQEDRSWTKGIISILVYLICRVHGAWRDSPCFLAEKELAVDSGEVTQVAHLLPSTHKVWVPSLAS